MGIIFGKISFFHKAFHGDFWKGSIHFHIETQSLIGNQTNHRTNMCLPYSFNSCYESCYECICIVNKCQNAQCSFKYFEQCIRWVKSHLLFNLYSDKTNNKQRSHTRPTGYKTFFMLNSAEHEISTSHKIKNVENNDYNRFRNLIFCIYPADNCWHFNIYK